ncbi:hypothetical protein EVA_14342 [gut metagenome]|uniref:Uncharacterized protein n=1 Tax=gut metagenome TaxID=749906 RepID=J9CCB0_9ZZZZ
MSTNHVFSHKIHSDTRQQSKKAKSSSTSISKSHAKASASVPSNSFHASNRHITPTSIFRIIKKNDRLSIIFDRLNRPCDRLYRKLDFP